MLILRYFQSTSAASVAYFPVDSTHSLLTLPEHQAGCSLAGFGELVSIAEWD